MSITVVVAGVNLEVEVRGTGRPLLFLHPGEGLEPHRPWLDLLAQRWRVIAPWHPGYGGSELPGWLSSVDDLAYLYLDLAAQMKLEDAILVGACFGGWVAAELAVRDARRFARLALVAPLGIKNGGVLERDIADMHGMPRADYLALAWADPRHAATDYTTLPESEIAAGVRGREAFTLFGWKPYMHNPRLKRWLHRIELPTILLWGDRDGIVTPAYGEGWRASIPGAKLEVIANAGHFPHWEQPQAFVERLSAFVDAEPGA